MASSSSKTVVELKKIVEKHCFEFKLPPLTRLTRKFIIYGRSAEFTNLQFSHGIFLQQKHKLDCSLNKNEVGLKLELPREKHFMTFNPNIKTFNLVIDLDLIFNDGTKTSTEVNVNKIQRWDEQTDVFCATWFKDSAWGSIDTCRVLISFKMEVESRTGETLTPSTEDKINEAASKKTNTFAADFFLSESLSDVELICGNQRFPAHRVILSYKSPVFKSMFEHGMKESLEGRVVIEDIEPEILQEMLRHIYTGNAEFSPKVQVELFKAAEKYNLENLKSECVQKISMDISTGNALDVYALGSTYNSELLCETAFNIIKENQGVIAENPEKFRKLTVRFPDLLLKLYCQLKEQKV